MSTHPGFCAHCWCALPATHRGAYCSDACRAGARRSARHLRSMPAHLSPRMRAYLRRTEGALRASAGN